MKGAHILIAAVILVAVTASFFLSNIIPTGLLTAVSGGDGLRITSIKTTDTTATINWETAKESSSTLIINNNPISFSKAKEFSSEVSGLNEGTAYGYTIRACNEQECQEKTGQIKTKSAKTQQQLPQITGAVVKATTDTAEDIAQTTRKYATTILYALLAVTALAIGGRISYQKISNNKDEMGGMITKAEEMIESQQYTEAQSTYSKARQAFAQLEEEAKLKHYDRLLKIYHTLKRQYDMIEAQRLAEKYSQGTITRDELTRLNELLAS